MGAIATAPLAIVTGGVTTIIVTTGVIGLGLIYALVALALIAFSLASSALVSHTGIAAGLHTYVARGLGERLGLGIAVVMAVSYTTLAVSYYGIIGYEIQNLLRTNAGLSVPWLFLVLPFVALVAFLGMRSLRTSAIVTVVVLAVVVVAHFFMDLSAISYPSAEGYTAETLDPVTLFTGAVGAAIGFSVTAYPGIETPMAYGGELRATSRQVTTATYLAVGMVGIANVIAAVTVTSAIGPDNLAYGGLEKASGPILGFLASHFGSGAAQLIGLANLVAIFGAALILHHAATRSIRSLGAAGVLPPRFAKRSTRSGAPVNASLLQTGLGIVVMAVFAVAGADPFQAMFIILSSIGSVGVFLSLICAAIAVMVFLLRSDSEEGGFLGWEGKLVAAIVAALCLGAVLISALLESSVRLGVPAGSLAAQSSALVVIVALLIGVLWPARRRAPRSLALDEEDEYATPVSASPALAHLMPGGPYVGPAMPTGSYATPQDSLAADGHPVRDPSATYPPAVARPIPPQRSTPPTGSGSPGYPGSTVPSPWADAQETPPRY